MSHLKLVTSGTPPHSAAYVEALEHLDTGICLIADDGAVLANNRRFRHLLGLPANWPSPKAAAKTVSAAEELVTGWVARVEAQGSFSESVVLSDQVTLRVEGKTLPSGGVTLGVAEIADADWRKLRESEERFRGVVQNMADIYYHSDLRGKSTLGQAAIGRLLGYEPQEFEVLNWRDLHVDPDRRAKFLETLDRNGGQVRDFESAFRHKNGETVWLSSNARYRYGDDGELAGIEGVIRNITGQKLTREVLRRSEESLRQAQRLAGIGHWERNIVTGEIYWSDEVFEFFEIDKNGSPDLELMVSRIHPEDRWLLRDSWDEISAGGTYQETEYRIELPSGRTRYLRDVLEAEFDSDGRPTRIFGAAQDITEAKLAEKALRESEAQLRAVIDNADEVILLKGLDGRFLLAGKGFEAAHGVPLEAVIGKTAHDITPDEFADAVVEQDNRIIETGQAIREEMTATFADGSEHALLVSKFPVRDDAGNIVGIGAINTDITEQAADRRALAESEAAFRSLLTHSPDSISLKDAEGKFQIVNEKAAEIFGLSADEMIGKTIWELLPDGDWDEPAAADKLLLSGEQTLFEHEIPVHVPGRGNRVFRRTKFPVLNRDRQPVGVGTIATDITERIQARDALRRSEAGLRHAQKLARIGNWEKNLITGDVYWSDEIFEILGIEKQPVPAFERVLDYIHPDDRQKLRDKLDSVFAGVAHHDIEFRVITPTGEVRYAHELSEVDCDSDGQPVRCVGVIQDVTEARLAEQALRESEQWFRSVIDNIPATLNLKNPDGSYRYANKQFRECYGLTLDQIIGRTGSELFAEETAEAVAVLDKLVLETGDAAQAEVPVTFADGSAHTLLANKFVVRDDEGAVIGSGLVGYDITENKRSELALRESEVRFRALVDNLPAGVILKGADGNVVFVNERIEEWYGVPLERLAGEKFHDVTVRSQDNELTHKRMLDAQRAVRETGKAVDIEFPMTFADGTEHELHAVIFPVERDDGGQNDVGNITFDITDRKHTEELLRQAQKMEVVGQLTGGVAHDFNNLLAVVIGNLEMAADGLQADTPVFDYVRNAFNAAERGASLTHHLLAFARQQVLQPEEIDLARLIGETKELMAVSMGEKITVKLQTGADLWRCKLDQVQLQNAILNLSINARDAMPSGGNVTISVENKALDATQAEDLELGAGDYICLSVSDNGPGIPEHVLQHVFEPFFTTKDVGEGSGLGLSMVYGFVRQSGGGVEIVTSEDEGTSVRLYFPVIESNVDTVVGIAAERTDVETETDATILLVEDNAAFREITRTILESLNFRVIDFGTAEDALAVIGDTTRFDLLLSDIGLPGKMNGHDLAEFAASARPGLKIVLMSAHTDPAVIGGVIDGNVSAFIRKPHRKAELNATLRQMIDA